MIFFLNVKSYYFVTNAKIFVFIYSGSYVRYFNKNKHAEICCQKGMRKKKKKISSSNLIEDCSDLHLPC